MGTSGTSTRYSGSGHKASPEWRFVKLTEWPVRYRGRKRAWGQNKYPEPGCRRSFEMWFEEREMKVRERHFLASRHGIDRHWESLRDFDSRAQTPQGHSCRQPPVSGLQTTLASVAVGNPTIGSGLLWSTLGILESALTKDMLPEAYSSKTVFTHQNTSNTGKAD